MIEWFVWAFAQVQEPRRIHPTRRRILAIVEAEPGITLTQLRSHVGCSWGTIHYHTQKLERQEQVRSEPVGRSRRFFLGSTSDDARRGVAALRTGRIRELVQAILDRPGAVQKELTGDLNLSRKVMRGYVDHLVDAGLVLERHHPRTRTYHPTDALHALLEEPELLQTA